MEPPPIPRSPAMVPTMMPINRPRFDVICSVSSRFGSFCSVLARFDSIFCGFERCNFLRFAKMT